MSFYVACGQQRGATDGGASPRDQPQARNKAQDENALAVTGKPHHFTAFERFTVHLNVDHSGAAVIYER